MDKERIKGAADKAKGAIRDAAGAMTGDKKLQAEGKRDEAKGAPCGMLADAKEAARDLKTRIDAARSAADYAEANAGDLEEE